MKKIRRMRVILVMTMLTAVIIHASQKRQGIQTNLDSVTTTDALVRVLNVSNVPGGIVVVSRCAEPIKHPVKLTGSSLRDKLNSIVLADPEYVWRMENGVVNFVYRGDNPPLLNIRIAQFKMKNVKTVYEALDQLLNTPEVQEGAIKLNLGSQLLRAGIGYYGLPAGSNGSGNTKFTVNHSNVTVREVLNTIAQAHGRGVWVYTQAYCKKGNFFTVDFLAP